MTTQAVENYVDPASGSNARVPGERVNVSQPERIASAVAGGGLLMYGLRRGSLAGLTMAAAGGGLLYRAATGHCHLYGALGANTANEDTRRALAGARGVHVCESVKIDVPVEEIYDFWRNLENLPRFMDHLESVTVKDSLASHWIAKAPAGATVEWDAEIINEVPHKVIGWRSLPGSDVVSAGSVSFKPARGRQGTEVTARLQYAPPGGKVGAVVASLFGEEPSQQIAADLEKLKELLENGEPPASRP